ncbi:hypothetical protein STAS_35525 [Striga asiatica]|uniref:Uncharacterized protein n=1 Tax=Striga asiatica TaxID=4170 RepID=A0A5A7RKH4_STRAF|nr:hypothetical protein STAS_35525 [Striga asiatica]
MDLIYHLSILVACFEVPHVNGPMSMVSGQIEVEFARCDYCGLTEECTLTYTETIRECLGGVSEGKWVCGWVGAPGSGDEARCGGSCDEARSGGQCEELHLLIGLLH